MRLRNKLYKKYGRHRTEDTWEHYRLQRNLVTKLKRITINDFAPILLLIQPHSTVSGKKLKPLLPSEGRDVSQEDIHLIDDGKVIKEPSNIFNSFLSTPILDQSVLKLKQEESTLAFPPLRLVTLS